MKLKTKVRIMLLVSLFVSAGLAYAISFAATKLLPYHPDPAMQYMSLIILRAVLAIAILVVLFFLQTHKITKPITALTTATGRIAAGDFNVDIQVPQSGDEISVLASNFLKMTEALQKNEYMAKDFIQNASHEFKTPLATLLGYVQMLENTGMPDEERKRCAALAVEEIDRLSGITSDILLLSRLEAQTMLPEPSMFSLDEQLRQVILALEPKWSAKRLQVEAELSEYQYEGYEELLERVWLNLIDNAIKFTPAGGAIAVRLLQGGGMPCVTISDNGTGIEQADQERIFERFFQSDNSRKSMGSGLGLSIVKRIVSLHRGDITVRSQPQKGAVFAVALRSMK